MNEDLSIYDRLRVELEKRDLLNRICKYPSRFHHTNYWIWNVKRSQEYPLRFDDDFYEEILNQLSVIEKVNKNTRNVKYLSPPPEINDYLNSPEFKSTIDGNEYRLLKKFRYFGKEKVIYELNYWITKMLKFKQSKILSFIELMKRSGNTIQETSPQFYERLYEYERTKIRSFCTNPFNTYQDYHSYFEEVYFNYFLYNKELIHCYTEIWESVELEKESLESLILFVKSSNFMLEEDLHKQIEQGYNNIP